MSEGWLTRMAEWTCPVCATPYERRPDRRDVHGCPACGRVRVVEHVTHSHSVYENGDTVAATWTQK